MKKYLLALLIIPVLFFVSYDLVSAQTEIIYSPAAGAEWQQDKDYTVGWIIERITPPLIITLTCSGCATDSPVRADWDSPNDGSELITIPMYLPAGDYRIFIHTLDNSYLLSSQSFKITAATPTAFITVDAPAEGAVWQADVANNITWRSGGITSNMVINRYASSDTARVNSLATVTLTDASSKADGPHIYTVPSNVLTSGSYFYTITGNGITAPSGNFTVTDDGGPPPPPPPHRSWAPPLYAPTECDGALGFDPGCWPPINVSVEPQIKEGGLGVRDLSISAVGFLKLLGLPAAAGQFLTTDSTGRVVLGAPGTGPGGTPDNYSCPDGQSIGTIANGLVTRCEPDDVGGGDGPTDSNVWQKRVSSSCAEGSSIRGIDVNGGVTCEPDDVGAGTYSFTVRTGGGLKNQTRVSSTVQNGDTVTLLDCTDGQVLKWNGNLGTASKWECGTVSGGATYTADETTLTKNTSNVFSIKDGGVTNAKIGNSAVRTNNIFPGAVVNGHLDSNAVTTSKIGDEQVTTDKLAVNAVTNSKLDVTYNIFTCTNSQWPGSTACELGTYKFCALTGVRKTNVACSLNPTTSRASSFNDYQAKAITSGSISGSKWWYLEAAEANVFSAGSCRAICY
ncbi:MAG: hypothetical protein HY481_01100 [Candidatus Vogelbacteria bacterium]|nr:hypothetical protein [Candidatus Vogelbacteria bacterium]